MGILLNNYCHQTTNDFEKLIKKEGLENTFPMIISILLGNRMHIKPTRLSKNNAPNIKFNMDGTIHEKLVVI